VVSARKQLWKPRGELFCILISELTSEFTEAVMQSASQGSGQFQGACVNIDGLSDATAFLKSNQRKR
jgi:hypothetical protein